MTISITTMEWGRVCETIKRYGKWKGEDQGNILIIKIKELENDNDESNGNTNGD